MRLKQLEGILAFPRPVICPLPNNATATFDGQRHSAQKLLSIDSQELPQHAYLHSALKDETEAATERPYRRECMSIIITLSDEQKAQLDALMHPEYANYCLAIQETAHSRKTSPGAKGRFSVDMLMQFRNDVHRKLSELT